MLTGSPAQAVLLIVRGLSPRMGSKERLAHVAAVLEGSAADRPSVCAGRFDQAIQGRAIHLLGIQLDVQGGLFGHHHGIRNARYRP